MAFSFPALIRGVNRGLAAYGRGRMEGEELRQQREERAKDRQMRLEESLRDAMLRQMGTKLQERALESQIPYRQAQTRAAEELARLRGRTRRTGGTAGTGPATREALQALERQIDDTRAELAQAQRQVPERPIVFVSPVAEQQWNWRAQEAGRRVRALQGRLDSLGARRDTVAAQVQGRPLSGQPTGLPDEQPPAPAAPPAPDQRPAPGRLSAADIAEAQRLVVSWPANEQAQALQDAGYSIAEVNQILGRR